ncbi:hypothetical protein [Deinococcus carri]|uniref:hypothetical protein n=1 Tax=Deinococcus carri TaxID=1211323 RepID=UPI0031EF828E
MTLSEEQRQKYNKFVSGVSLTSIRLGSCSVESEPIRPSPSKTKVELEFETSLTEATFQTDAGEFDAVAQIAVKFSVRETGDPVGTIRASYRLTYTGQDSSDLDTVRLFVKQNVPVNAWPYLREFVHTTMQRMDWPPFILPPMRRGPTKKKTAASKKAAAPTSD